MASRRSHPPQLRKFHKLPMTPLFGGLEVVTMGGQELQSRRYESLPPLMRISHRALEAIYPHAIGDFGHKHRRMITIDRDTVECFRSGYYKHFNGTEGFVYCYTFEQNIIAGHYTEEHIQKFLFFELKKWETHHYFPQIKIGCSFRRDGEVATTIMDQFSNTRAFAEPPTLLFLMYSTNVTGSAGSGLERSVHNELKKRKYWLRTESYAEVPVDLSDMDDQQVELYNDVSLGTEWFQCPVSEAYSGLQSNRGQ
jgi:hypothetical protein